MGELGFYYNCDRCIGCRVCQIACNDRNNLVPGVLYRKVRSYETGVFPTPGYFHYSATCNHCNAPACVANCPTGAMQKDANGDGTVQHDDELCIGCGNCVKSCPYQVPALLEDKGIAGKCDACKPFRDAGLKPVCVDACPLRVLDFGDKEELANKYGGELVNALPCLPLPDATQPNTLINPRLAALETEFREVVI